VANIDTCIKLSNYSNFDSDETKKDLIVCLCACGFVWPAIIIMAVAHDLVNQPNKSMEEIENKYVVLNDRI
jgi:hypothetical protein